MTPSAAARAPFQPLSKIGGFFWSNYSEFFLKNRKDMRKIARTTARMLNKANRGDILIIYRTSDKVGQAEYYNGSVVKPKKSKT